MYICALIMEQRERIVEEATGQFFRYGIRNVRMDDIAAALGISKRTMYETFKDKTELVHTVLLVLTHQQETKNRQLMDGPGNVIETIFVFMQEGIRVMNSINPVFFSDLKKFYHGVWSAVHNENVKSAYNITHLLLHKGLEEGIFRKDISIPIVSKLFHEQMNLISEEKIFPRDQFDHAEVFRNLIINFMRGISTSRGIEIIDTMLENKEQVF
jgi:TetR/AcrR family transcriptional regulator, cholesterol catabolism regulator